MYTDIWLNQVCSMSTAERVLNRIENDCKSHKLYCNSSFVSYLVSAAATDVFVASLHCFRMMEYNGMYIHIYVESYKICTCSVLFSQ